MKLKSLIFFCAFPLAVQTVHAGTETSFGLGLRSDKLNWNIASDITGTSTPNILSELQWKTTSLELALNVEYYAPSHLHLLINGNYSLVSQGDNQDSDYDGNNRTSEFSRSQNSGDGSTALGAMFGVGFRIGAAPGQARTTVGLIPLFGYSMNNYNAKITDGYQVISTASRTPAPGPFSGLNSTYDATFKGPWAGAEFYVDRRHGWRLFVNYYHHKAKYHAEANWNLRSDFAHPVSYTHDADGTGDVINIGVNFTPTADWSTSIVYGYEKWHTEPGIDTTYFSSGAVATTRLNEVNWEVRRLLLMAMYSF